MFVNTFALIKIFNDDICKHIQTFLCNPFIEIRNIYKKFIITEQKHLLKQIKYNWFSFAYDAKQFIETKYTVILLLERISEIDLAYRYCLQMPMYRPYLIELIQCVYINNKRYAKR